ncbi:hypothetical protein PYH37_005152 [Sinorhizobium numidicum]|uniref:Transmembrane protein n=1 Tax=Sinorhizobium numidicum TaxID=680248 RepID=A0ABY8D2U2_9HYPH|nr:hypothetical protein [Sinorhizobium numidicum]WEX76810.1 hypothetical protein PYH37_005152 [Sinorhizobium numidicum]WEX83471.1 hypothetical protein PYH38_002245 [Sinorhizobium numidicum]
MQAFRRRTAGIDLIPPERRPRPSAAVARNLDFIDVEFETLAANRRSPYPVFNDNRPSAGQPVLRTTTSRVAGAKRQVLTVVEARLRAMPARRFVGLVAGLGFMVFLLIAGLGGQDHSGARPLTIQGVTTSLDYSGGMRVLSVYGTIDNRSGKEQHLPTVIVDVTSNGRKVTATRLMPEGMAIAPGESRHFVTRLPYAGGKMPNVTVSFAENGVSVL